MRILSHRGFWRKRDEMNSLRAFDRTIAQGFGTETDVRDCSGRLVVSHDPATSDAIAWSEVVERFDGQRLPLAINVKADGLLAMLKEALSGRDIEWFAFDMSGPETIRYARAGVPFFTRHSDFEVEPILYDNAVGVWLDDFRGDWSIADPIRCHLNAGKRVCVVSSELHDRDCNKQWADLKAIGATDDRLMLCTDIPNLAREFFD